MYIIAWSSMTVLRLYSFKFTLVIKLFITQSASVRCVRHHFLHSKILHNDRCAGHYFYTVKFYIMNQNWNWAGQDLYTGVQHWCRTVNRICISFTRAALRHLSIHTTQDIDIVIMIPKLIANLLHSCSDCKHQTLDSLGLGRYFWPCWSCLLNLIEI